MCEWQVQHITRLVDESKTEHSALSRQRLDLLDCLDLDKAVEAIGIGKVPLPWPLSFAIISLMRILIGNSDGTDGG